MNKRCRYYTVHSWQCILHTERIRKCKSNGVLKELEKELGSPVHGKRKLVPLPRR